MLEVNFLLLALQLTTALEKMRLANADDTKVFKLTLCFKMCTYVHSTLAIFLFFAHIFFRYRKAKYLTHHNTHKHAHTQARR